jgi:vacuolar-type H+-ATPase subunit E/Vma4
MAIVDGSVEDLNLAIVSEARLESEDLKTKAQAIADDIRQRARAEAESLRKSILGAATQHADRLRAQALASAKLKARAQELGHREALLDQVFDAARQRLLSVPKRKDYPEIARQLLHEALQQLHSSSAVVLADAEARRAIGGPGLEAVARELDIQASLGPVLDAGLGVIAQTADGHLQFDNTLESRLARLQGGLRSVVYRILVGEKP